MAKKQKWFQKTEKILYEYKTFDAAIRVLEAERTRLLGPLSEDIMPPLGTSVVKLGQGSTKTVSYTHLDVYKRQERRISSSWVSAASNSSFVSAKRSCRKETVKLVTSEPFSWTKSMYKRATVLTMSVAR